MSKTLLETDQYQLSTMLSRPSSLLALIALTATVSVAAALPVATRRDTPAYEMDEVKTLPGWDGALPSRHFSGYLQASSTKRLHYYLVQSEGDWNKDPVVLWFNGGPGCSSLDGFLYEHGITPASSKRRGDGVETIDSHRSLPRAVRRQGSLTRPLRLRLVQARDDGLYRSAVRRRVLLLDSEGHDARLQRD